MESRRGAKECFFLYFLLSLGDDDKMIEMRFMMVDDESSCCADGAIVYKSFSYGVS